MRMFSGGRNTVPQIGDNDDLQELDVDGKLLSRITSVQSNAEI